MQQFSEIDTLLIAKEIKKHLLWKRVKTVRGFPLHFNIVFEGDFSLYVDLRPKFLRIHLTKREASDEEHPFENQIRGLTLKDIKVREGDRVLYILFGGRGRDVIFAVELTGKHSNAIVLNEKGTIMMASKEIGEEISRKRQVKPGVKYAPPPKKPLSLMEKTAEILIEKTPYIKYVKKLDDILSSISPVLYFDKNLNPLYYSPVETHEGGIRVYTKLYSQVVELYFDFLERMEEKAKLVEKREKTKKILEDELEKLKDYEMERRRGEIILANINKLRGKSGKFRIEGIDIEIQEGKTPEEMAEFYFKLYKKKKSGFQKVMEKLEKLHLIEKRVEKLKEKKEDRTLPYIVYRSPNNFRVLVGKNARGNELITFGIASKRDLFFHIKDSPGAHVILLREGREPKEEDIRFAANLALIHSKASLNLKGLVSFCEVQDLRRAKGKRGAVIIRKEKILNVRI